MPTDPTASMRSSPPLFSSHYSHGGAAPDSSICHADAINYWSSVSPTVNGMLGGFPQISRIDLQGSRTFMGKLLRKRQDTGREKTPPTEKLPDDIQESQERKEMENGRRYPTRRTKQESISVPPVRSTESKVPLLRAADCGAGIGRITHGLLLSLALTVDVIEPVPQFTAEIAAGELFAPYRIPSTTAASPHIGDIFNIGLEAWTPSSDAYDLIWNQWCLGQLTDAQLVAYLRRCRQGLRRGGWVIVKENVSTHPQGEDVFDEQDSSVTRSEANWGRLFKESGMTVVLTELQRGFPKSLGLFPVRSWALQPA